MSFCLFEELDFFICWLGFIFVIYVRGIRVLIIDNLYLGIKRLWIRLDEWFSFFEMVELVLMNILLKFLKFIDSNVKKFYEFFDLLLEILCLKRNLKYCDFFSYYDIFVGVKLIVIKLISNL